MASWTLHNVMWSIVNPKILLLWLKDLNFPRKKSMVKPLRIGDAKHWCQKDIDPRSSCVKVQTQQRSPEGTAARSQLGKSEHEEERLDGRQAAGCESVSSSWGVPSQPSPPAVQHHALLLTDTLYTRTTTTITLSSQQLQSPGEQPLVRFSRNSCHTGLRLTVGTSEDGGHLMSTYQVCSWIQKQKNWW